MLGKHLINGCMLGTVDRTKLAQACVRMACGTTALRSPVSYVQIQAAYLLKLGPIQMLIIMNVMKAKICHTKNCYQYRKCHYISLADAADSDILTAIYVAEVKPKDWYICNHLLEGELNVTQFWWHGEYGKMQWSAEAQDWIWRRRWRMSVHYCEQAELICRVHTASDTATDNICHFPVQIIFVILFQLPRGS